MNELMQASFQIIAAMGGARSSYIEAVKAAKQGNFDQAQELIATGDKSYLEGHAAHSSLIQKEASGDSVNMTLISTHAEDQMMSAEIFKTMALEFIDVYRRQSA